MNVYCEVCHGEMEIMRDLGTELHVYPCGCSGKQASRPTPYALDRLRRWCAGVLRWLWYLLVCFRPLIRRQVKQTVGLTKSP